MGKFKGNFLIKDWANKDTLLIVSSKGKLVSEVNAINFPWIYSEGITEITSGPYEGNFAIIGMGENACHLSIFRIEDVHGIVNAYIVKDIIGEDLGGIGICFLNNDDPDQTYGNHFVTQDSSGALAIFDDDGNKQISYSVDYYYEGLAYINDGPYKGN